MGETRKTITRNENTKNQEGKNEEQKKPIDKKSISDAIPNSAITLYPKHQRVIVPFIVYKVICIIVHTTLISAFINYTSD